MASLNEQQAKRIGAALEKAVEEATPKARGLAVVPAGFHFDKVWPAVLATMAEWPAIQAESTKVAAIWGPVFAP